MNYLYCCYSLMKLNFLDRFSEFLNKNIHGNLFSVSRIFPCGWTERHDKASLRLKSPESDICNLTMYVSCILFQCVDKPTRCNISYE